MLRSLEGVGLSHVALDVVALSHLHFDHAGGLLTAFEADREPELLFPNATFVVGREAWERAKAPHARDRASFIPALPRLLEESGRLEIVDGQTTPALGDGYRFHFSEGHTPGLMLTEVAMEAGPVVFAGDLVPGVPWVHLTITMGYDRFPERLIDEKKALFGSLGQGARLFFTHDPEVAIGTLSQDDRGRWTASSPVAAPATIRA